MPCCAKDEGTEEGGRGIHISVLVTATEEGCENAYERIFDIFEGSLLGGTVKTQPIARSTSQAYLKHSATLSLVCRHPDLVVQYLI
jgi:hypothetical protein